MAPALLVLSALLHALWNALLKREPSPERSVAGVLGFAALTAAVAAFASPGAAFATRAALGWGLGAGAFEGLYFVTLAAALARADYGVVYTVARGGAMLVVWPAGALLLRQPITALALGGALLVAVGLALVGWGRSGGRTRRSARGLAFAVACAAAIAGYHLCYDRALAAGARPAPLYAVALAIALPAPLVLALRARPAAAPGVGAARRALRWAVAGSVCTASFLLFLVGLAASGAAVALTLRNSSVCFAQAIAFAIGERPTRAQVAGALVVAAGATLVSLG